MTTPPPPPADEPAPQDEPTPDAEATAVAEVGPAAEVESVPDVAAGSEFGLEDLPEVGPTSEPEAAAEPESRPEDLAEVEAVAEPGDHEPEPQPETADTELGSPEASGVEPSSAQKPTAEPDSAPEESDGGDDEGITTSDLPDLTEDTTFHAALEALLLVIDGPAEEESLADALDQPVKRVRASLEALASHYRERDRGIDLRNVGGGWRFHTRDKFAPFVEKLLLGGQRAKLTRAALESLAVIAYRQPVTRARVAAVRGVNVDGVIRTLLVRGLIEETGTDRDTGGILYRTTELFLERLGLSSLEDLPPIAPLLPEVDAIDDV